LDGLARLARDKRNGPDIQTAILSSVSKTADSLAELLIKDVADLPPQVMHLLSQLSQIAGATPTTAMTVRMLSSATAAGVSPAAQRAILTGLGKGLAARGSSVSAVLADKSTSDAIRQQVAALFERAFQSASDESKPLSDREASIGLLAFADAATATSRLSDFLSPQTPQPLQRAAVVSLAQQESDDVARTLLAGWKTYSPQIRLEVADALVVRTSRIMTLLDAVQAGSIKPSDLTRDRKQLLMNHPNTEIRSRSQKVLGSDVNSNRARVVDDYQDVLSLDGDAERGLAVFKKICSACHQVGEIGHKIAPNLASVQNKSSADLLLSILDPNREAQPNFNVYTVVTNQGRLYSGIIATESAGSITLRRAEAKEDVILRSSIDELVSTGISLMPEGLEKDLSRQNLADVMTFVKSIKPPEAALQNK
ncbi:MAG: c-type cytochrome, partial [Planctomycetota bacterium]|nr:c-type cytochrome [Planctomycetota bacterium]